ncbi:MAG: hypothetical protein EP326_10820 [Deltaproteobacteria bacterium]|nr:MAG: hypothetical protein EP326_10820 [Deltaproteobacteria bacterium]
MIGILMMFIFLWDLNRKNGWTAKRNEKLKARSCNAVLVKVEKRLAANWKAYCEQNSLAVEVDFTLDKAKLKDPNNFKRVMYRELANNLVLLAKLSPSDNLERTDYVRVRLKHKDLTINALSQGRHVAKFQTLTTPEMIAQHLQATVTVQEVPAQK